MVGEQYIKMTSSHSLRLPDIILDSINHSVYYGDKANSFVSNDADLWQVDIVMNANTIMPGVIGNFPGDDEAKIRGIKYVVTGDCNSDEIEVKNLGTYDMKESLLSLYKDEISAVFKSKNYIIGNAVLKPQDICHSFVLMDMWGNKIQIYDPWNGSAAIYDIHDVFENGFMSEKGVGIIKWIQFINCNV